MFMGLTFLGTQCIVLSLIIESACVCFAAKIVVSSFSGGRPGWRASLPLTSDIYVPVGVDSAPGVE